MKHIAALMSLVWIIALAPPLAGAHGEKQTEAMAAPAVDHHQHLFSPAAAALVSTPETPFKAITAADLMGMLDAAGIRRAVVLSMAYTYGHVNRTVENEYEKVKAENDWTSQQVALYPDRLRGFCSFNPLKDYAEEEFARCLKDPRLRSGLKLHFGNADVQVTDPAHIKRLQDLFRRINAQRMALIVHMRASISRKRPYGRAAARIFLNELVPAAPDVPIQIAHFAGGGTYSEAVVDEAMSVFIEAIRSGDPRTKNLYFDVSGVVRAETPAEEAKLLATRIREVGVERVFYGSDAAAGGNAPPREAWAAFRKLPLTEAEFRTIAANVAPYLR
jgi:predicted TIM-barrel fold metal-dependent hydrolase